jgi:hypothetical protein
MAVRNVLLLTFLLVASPAQAASLTLGCSGTETITQIRGYEVASDPEKETILDQSVVVDVDQRTISGLWQDLDRVHIALPITAVDDNGVIFRDSPTLNGVSTYIAGTLDRITGKLDATEAWYKDGVTHLLKWDMRCKPRAASG